MIEDDGKPEEVITISRKEYNRLREAEHKLARLECAGVDNWEGYGYAMYPGDTEDVYGGGYDEGYDDEH
jgi:hypothetical protein